MSTPLPVSPVTATIDQNNFLTINWNPPAINGGYTYYQDWNIWLATGTFPFTPPGTLQFVNGEKPIGNEFTSTNFPSSRLYQEQLVQADYGLNMQAEPSAAGVTAGYTDSPLFNVTALSPGGSTALLPFPSPLLATDVTLDNTTLELGQTVTVSLVNAYPNTSAEAQFWQVNWPDNTTTGPLPLSNRSAAKSFSNPGSFDIVVLTWNDFSSLTPAVKLYRSLTIPIFVVDQQFNPAAAAQNSLTGTLGFGGSQGFEIVDAVTSVVTPNPWAMIARCLVRDTLTNELKDLILSSRFSNASSLLGTMAMDVFPLEGRPHAKELIVPDQILSVTSSTSAVPVQIITSTLPNVIVGKPMPQFQLQASGGTPSYAWYNDGTLPPGLSLSTNGTITGTPTQLGTFSVNLATIDASNPAFIAETTLTMTVATDLVITTPTIPNAQVLTPYVQQLVNTGGLAPYTWSIVAGAFPIGIVINPGTGQLTGTPCTYNSTTDFQTSFTATVQITDSIGAKATKTYTITLSAAPLQFGPVDNVSVFATQEFMLCVPVFGGQSPYTFNAGDFIPDTPSAFGTPVFTDGRVEAHANFPTTAAGPNGTQHSIVLNAGAIVDANSNNSPLSARNFFVGPQLADIYMENAYFAHYWSDSVSITEVAVNGSNVATITALNAFTVGQSVILSGLGVATFLNGQTLTVASLIGAGPVYTGFTANFTHGTYGPTPESQGIAQDAEEAVVQNQGTLSGFVLNPLTLATTNGLTAVVDPTLNAPNGQEEVTGPATAFSNSQTKFPLQVYNNGVQIGQISRVYTLMAHNDNAVPGEIGQISTIARTYVIGDFVGLNPRKPFWNSPDHTVIPGFTPSPSAVALTAQVASNSSLPLGLSLDANTGLIYGYLLGSGSSSTINYVDSSNLIHGTVSILWSSVPNSFSLINVGAAQLTSGGLNGIHTGSAYSIQAYSAPANVTLTGVTVSGNLPAGLTASIDNTGTYIVVAGTPTEAGYFDVWFTVQSSSGQASVYLRMAVAYIVPLVIVGQLPTISAQLYEAQVQVVGGTLPYVNFTASDTVNGPWLTNGPSSVGPTTGNFVGLSLNTTTGAISGTLTSPPGSSPTDLGDITFTVTDSTTPTAFTATAALDLIYNNGLRITTQQQQGIATVESPADPEGYSFQMQAAGGIPPYYWQITSTPGTPLPGGITFDNEAPTAPAVATNTPPGGGWFTGVYNGVPYTTTLITVGLSDSTSPSVPTVTGQFFMRTGTVNDLQIDSSSVGLIPRGQAYLGTMLAAGTYTAPIQWQVAPNTAGPNLLPAGLSLQPNASGTQCQIIGTYSGAPLTNYAVRIVNVDVLGNTGQTILMLSTNPHSVTITTTTLPNAVITASYSASLSATGGVGPYSYVIDPSTTGYINPTTIPTPGGSPTGLTLASNGTISGTATVLFTNNIKFVASDSLTPANTSIPTGIQLSSQAAGLNITTTQANLNANQPVAGVAYNFVFNAGGDANTPYTWSISPNSAFQLPTGLTLNPSTGAVSGTTLQSGYSHVVTIRVTDTISAYAEASFTFTVGQNLVLHSGIDYTDSTSTGFLGYIDNGAASNISPRPNLAFYIVATGVVSQSLGTLAASTNVSNVTATVVSLNTTNLTCQIALTGSGLNVPTPGTYSVTVTLTDNGVTVNTTFTWKVYSHGSSLSVTSPTLPTQLIAGSS